MPEANIMQNLIHPCPLEKDIQIEKLRQIIDGK